MGHQLWGTTAPRRFFGEAHWLEPLKWNNEAQRSGRRERVFCASMADVFERRTDLSHERQRLWKLIESTPSLDWLLLTKRPQNVEKLVPWRTNWPTNVWIGTSVENQIIAEKRLPFLLCIPAAIRFLSCEPLLGPLNLLHWFNQRSLRPIDWVIAGGESGSKSRPMHPDWVTNLLYQCETYNIPFLFKQWGQWAPTENLDFSGNSQLVSLPNERPVEMIRSGKKMAGRILNGITWDGVPSRSVTNA